MAYRQKIGDGNEDDDDIQDDTIGDVLPQDIQTSQLEDSISEWSSQDEAGDAKAYAEGERHDDDGDKNEIRCLYEHWTASSSEVIEKLGGVIPTVCSEARLRLLISIANPKTLRSPQAHTLFILSEDIADA